VTAMLPAEFADLEPYAPTWALGSEAERYAMRLSSSMEDMQAFYDAIVPRAKEAMEYLDGFPLEDLTDEQINLLHMLYSMTNVSFPIEVWRQPRVPDSGSASADCVYEPVP
jgi:hypothetical protein